MANKAIILTRTLNDIAYAINNKLGENSYMTASQMAERIQSIPQSVINAATVKPMVGILNFYDYDGNLLWAYTKQEVDDPNFELPPFPDREGVTYVRWSHDLAWIKDKVGTAEAPCLDVMPVCEVTPGDDGLTPTKLYLQLVNPSNEDYFDSTNYRYRGGVKLEVLFPQESGSIIVDWGDGTSPEIFSATGQNSVLELAHEYFPSSSSGSELTKNPIISIFPAKGTEVQLGSNKDTNMFPSETGVYPSITQAQLVAVEIGSGVKLSSYCFSNCASLQSVLLPASVGPLPGNVFRNCISLRAILIQKEHFGDSSRLYQFSGCSGMKTLVLCPDIDRIRNGAFQNCVGIENIVIPGSVVDKLGNLAFSCNESSTPCLRNLGICNGVTKIPMSAFAYIIKSVVSIKLPESIVAIEADAFNGITSQSTLGVALTKVIDLSLPSAAHGIKADVDGNNHAFLGAFANISFPPGFQIVLHSRSNDPHTGLLDKNTYGSFWGSYVTDIGSV